MRNLTSWLFPVFNTRGPTESHQLMELGDRRLHSWCIALRLPRVELIASGSQQDKPSKLLLHLCGCHHWVVFSRQCVVTIPCPFGRFLQWLHYSYSITGHVIFPGFWRASQNAKLLNLIVVTMRFPSLNLMGMKLVVSVFVSKWLLAWASSSSKLESAAHPLWHPFS